MPTYRNKLYIADVYIIPHKKILIDTGIANMIETTDSISVFYSSSDFQSYDGIKIVYWNWWKMN